MYPIFFHFQGGKGVATALGSIAPIGLGLSCMLIATWLLVIVLFRYSSLAAIITALLAPLYTWMIKPQYTLPVAMLACLIIFRHHKTLSACSTALSQKSTKKIPFNSHISHTYSKSFIDRAW